MFVCVFFFVPSDEKGVPISAQYLFRVLTAAKTDRGRSLPVVTGDKTTYPTMSI